MRAARAIAAVLAAGAACAQVAPPSGGEIPRVPPMVVSTEPEHLAIVEPGDRPLVFRFDKRISERGVADFVVVSPETGEVRVRHRRTSLEVRLRGGWQPGKVYRVELKPGLRDVYGNARTNPVEVVFSTGPEIQPTAVAGMVTDRITGRPPSAASLRVDAVNSADSTVYTASVDNNGLFAMRYLPTGSYRIRAYLDQNRNRVPDPHEASAESLIRVNVEDTALVALSILAPDSTAPRLVRAESPDSFHVRLTFDDHMDPGVPLEGVSVRLRTLPDSTEVSVDTVLFVADYREYAARTGRVAAPATAQDTAAADSLPHDDAADDAAAEPEPDIEEEEQDPLPVQELIVVPTSVLAPETQYEIEISGVVNLHGLVGGGTVTFRTPARPPPPDPVDDTAQDDAGAGAGGADQTPPEPGGDDAAPDAGVDAAADDVAGEPAPGETPP